MPLTTAAIGTKLMIGLSTTKVSIELSNISNPSSSTCSLIIVFYLP